MSITIKHAAFRTGLPVKDVAGFNGFFDPNNSQATAYLRSLVEGALVSIGSDGFVKLADGAADVAIYPLARGFVENDLGSNNTFGDGGLSVLFGTARYITDQIVSTEVFAPGDKLYAGTAANVGKVTKTAPNATAKVIGIAVNAASATQLNLEILTV